MGKGCPNIGKGGAPIWVKREPQYGFGTLVLCQCVQVCTGMKRREALESCCRATDSSCVEGVVKGDCGMHLGILRVWVLCEEVE